MEEKPTYSKAIAELESIVKQMQSNECSIDNLSQLASRSLWLLKVCKERLTHTDEEIQKILAELSDEQ